MDTFLNYLTDISKVEIPNRHPTVMKTQKIIERNLGSLLSSTMLQNRNHEGDKKVA